MVAPKSRSFVTVNASGEPENEGTNTAVVDTPPPIPQEPTREHVLGPIQRTTTTVEKANVIPLNGTAPSNVPATSPHPNNVALGTLPYIPAKNEHDEPSWPNRFQPYPENLNRRLLDDIWKFNKYDTYHMSCEQSLPAGASAFAGELPKGPYEDIVEYLKSYAVQNGFPDAAFRIGIFLTAQNKLVASYTVKFGNAKNILKGIEQDLDPELAEKEKELKRVKLETQINAELKRNVPPPVEKDDPMKLVMTMQKQSSEQTNALVTALAPVLAALVSKPAAPPPSNNNELLAMMMKMQNDSTKMMMEAQARQTELLVKMMETNKKPEGGMDMFKMFEMMRAMKEDIREDFQAAQPRDDDDIEVDPKNITGSLLAHGIKGLIHLFKTGGPAVAAAVAQVAASAGKNPTELTEADEPAVRAALNIPPAPAQIAMQPNPPAKKPVQQPQRRASITQLPPPKTLSELRQQTETALPPVLPAPEAAPEAITEETNETKSLMRNDLEGELLLSLDTMIADIRSGRIERQAPTWVEEACVRWHKDFLDQLCTIPAPVDRMKKVKEIVGAKEWEKVDIALAEVSASSTTGGCHYQFYLSFDTLKELWEEAKNVNPVKEGEENVKSE